MDNSDRIIKWVLIILILAFFGLAIYGNIQLYFECKEGYYSSEEEGQCKHDICNINKENLINCWDDCKCQLFQLFTNGAVKDEKMDKNNRDYNYNN